MIKVLDEKLINKIAAGEVIERPASVVKELIENSIDAGARKIEVDIKEYGKQLIRIADDGHGMKKEDAELSILRHATSKIGTEEDLTAIITLGFRGEALASIAAVSNLIILTRPKEDIEGFRLEVEGGRLLQKGATGCPSGTTIEVHNLFFNTPARLKFLKTDTNELKSIADIVTRYSLLYKNIAFKLAHNGHTLLNTHMSDDWLDSIAAVYGAESARQLLPIDYDDGAIRIKGYISKPSLLKSDRGWQNFYVNGRYVKNDTLARALYDAYHTLLFINKHPIAVLDIRLDPSSVDVNVHPTKDIIKFSENTRVYDSLFRALRHTLQENDLVTDYSAVPGQASLETPRIPMPKLDTMPGIAKKEPLIHGSEKQIRLETKQPSFETREEMQKLPRMRLLGQIAKTYFLAETDDGFMIIDQHVVEERINYEKFMKQFMGKNVATQTLMKPILIELSPEEKIIVVEHSSKLKDLGFEIEDFGDNSFMLRTVPTLFSRVQPKELLSEVLKQISENKKSAIEGIQEKIITRMACRASIKGGDDCSRPQMEELLKQLDRTELPWTCPHGRPVIIKFSKDEIEKMFRRKA